MSADPDAKMAAIPRPAIPRDWRLVALIGCVCFLGGFVLFLYGVPVGRWTAMADGPAATVAAALSAVAAMTITMTVRARALQVHNQRMRVALDNMSQGLCMFDGHQRLVVCNRRYAEMYRLPDEIARSGTTLRALLEYRAAHGTFAPDIANIWLSSPPRWKAARRAARKSNPPTAATSSSPTGR